jgi:HEAT repeat protein
LREWLAQWLGVGKARRLRAETRAEALSTAYRHNLVAELHNLKIMDVVKSLDLEASYILLRLCPSTLRLRSGQAPLMSPEEALLRFRHLAVLGDPGAGKTTMLRYLALLSAQGRLENLPDFPILVSLGHFAAVPQVNLLDFVIGEMEAHYGSPGPRPDGSTGSPRRPVEGLRLDLEERLEKGSVLLLLDGLDEADVGRPQEAEDTYRHVVGQINVLAARYPNCPMIVTARRENWKGLLAASFQTLEVLGFTRDDIQRFIDNWFGADPLARDLQSILSQNPRVWALAANPLLLSFMAFVFGRDGELPEGWAGLYERGVELLLRTTGGGNTADTEHKRSLLEEVALHFHLRRALLFPEDELREVIAGCLPTVLEVTADQVSSTPSAAPSLRSELWLRTGLEEISSQHGLLREQAVGWYGFPHPTWQEYLAAAAVSRRGWVENGEWRPEIGDWRLQEGLHDPWWEGTVLFLAGVLADATPLLESILAQEEDIFYSNLLLAGRCLAAGRLGELQVEGVGLDIIEGLKRLVEGGHHGLLQRQAVSVLAEIGGGAVVSFFTSLLRREEMDLDMHAEVVQVLGALHEKSIVPDFLAFLTDEKLALSVRGNIAEALGSLGDESVIPPLLAFLPDEMIDSAVRGKVAEALVTLGGESVVSPLLDLLPNEGIDPYVRERITEALASLADGKTSYQPFGRTQERLVLLLPDEKIHPSVRQRVAEAVGSWGDESAVPDLLVLLSDEKVDPSVRGKAAEALGTLGAESTVPPLLAVLGDEGVDYSVRMAVAEVLGVLGDESVAFHLLAHLSDEKIDPDVRASIAGALGVLGEKSVVPQLLSLLSDEGIDPAVRWRIIDALSSLGDKTIIPHLQALLPNEKIDSSVRWMVAEALEAWAGEPAENGRVEEPLGSLGDRSRIPHLLALLKDGKIDPSMSGRVIEALGSLGDDRATMEGLAVLLDREDIGSRVYKALFRVSQRAGLRVFARKGGGYEVRYSS